MKFSSNIKLHVCKVHANFIDTLTDHVIWSDNIMYHKVSFSQDEGGKLGLYKKGVVTVKFDLRKNSQV